MSDPLDLPLCSALETLIGAGCSPNHTHLKPPNVLHKKELVPSNSIENIFHMIQLVLIWNLVLVYRRDEKENFPVLGIFVCFLSLRFFPLKMCL